MKLQKLRKDLQALNEVRYSTVLGLLAYKILSDRQRALNLKDEPATKERLGYYINPDNYFDNLVGQDLSSWWDALGDFEERNLDFAGIFEDIFDTISSNLNVESVKDVIQTLAKYDLTACSVEETSDFFEQVITDSAENIGKKRGDFVDSPSISNLISSLLATEIKKPKITVYDPVIGMGSLELALSKKHSGQTEIYGEEINNLTYNLLKMNMLVHGIEKSNCHFKNGDCLEEDWPKEEPTKFDLVMMTPPFSQKWNDNPDKLKEPRFAPGGVLAPKSRADYSFIMQGLYHLNGDGTMGIVTSMGTLFREAREGKIREYLLEQGNIDAVIGLPGNLFYNTSIPTALVILKKKAQNNDVLFIEASKDHETFRRRNYLSEKNIQKIVEAYQKRQDVHRFAHVASLDEIRKNNYSLNLPRYVDTFEMKKVDSDKVFNEAEKNQKEIAKHKSQLIDLLQGLDSKESKLAVESLVK